MRILFARCLVILVLTAPLSPVLAQMDSRPVKVILFKNGLSWVEEQAKGTTGELSAQFPLHAPPLFGSLLVTSTNGRKIVSMKTVPQSTVGTSAAARLGTGQGTAVFVSADGKTQRGTLRGEILLGGSGPAMLVMEVSGGTLLVPATAVQSLELEGDAQALLSPAARQNWPLELRMDAPGDLAMSATYLTRGSGWVPEYRLEVLKDEKVRFHMDALVVNNGLELQDTEVQFATGEASFPFQWTDSPLFSPDATADGLTNQVMGVTRQPMSPQWGAGNMMVAQQRMDNDFSPYEVPAQGPTEVHESYLYGPARLTLARGERAVIPLAEASVPGRVIVYWEPGYANHVEPADAGASLALVMTNNQKFPWTTGAALVTQDGRPLGQSTIAYTSPDSEALLKVALATTVRCSLVEEQKEREERARTVNKVQYDRMVMEGEAEVTNHKAEPVVVRVRKDISGKVLASSNDGKVQQRAPNPSALVPVSTITWEVTIPAGKTMKLTYQYETFVVHGSGYDYNVGSSSLR